MSEGLARRLFPGAGALGQRLRFYAFPDTTWEIAGIVADVKTGALDQAPQPTIYYANAQGLENRLSFVVRADRDLSSLALPIGEIVRRLDPEIPAYQMVTLDQHMTESPAVLTRRLPLVFIGAFAVLAVVLSVLGLYGVVAYQVTGHRREIGVRIALGASRGDVMTLILRHGAKLAGIGLAIGTLLALALGGALKSLLYQVQPVDPVTIAAVALGLGATTLVACWVPARRAGRLDPVEALRE